LIGVVQFGQQRTGTDADAVAFGDINGLEGAVQPTANSIASE
jgi:hypothetical protein